ncbi:cysteine hydrolase [Alphaproteobacteria bacterium]|jgi:nicotinamidase-related amidase|nr:cysteine hydrolase [Alphaproteobacteria bacterium]MDC0649178.1 cysteine hydrolase [Alphaproteobacteria bacterium]
MNDAVFDPKSTAVLIVDLQNDFLHPDGAYGRSGTTNPDIAALPEKILPLLKIVRAAGGWVVSTQFTLVPGRDGEPFISTHLKKLRPFLTKGDFTPSSWGHSLVDSLQPADITVEKVAYSAFYQSRMEFALSRARVKTLMVCGIVTNGGVASTVRDAHVRDFQTITLSDGCAAFSAATHNVAIQSLATVGEVITIAEAIRRFEEG